MLSLNLPFLVGRSERKRFTEPAIIDAELFACLVEKLVFIDIEVIQILMICNNQQTSGVSHVKKDWRKLSRTENVSEVFLKWCLRIVILHPLRFEEGQQVSYNWQRKAHTWNPLSSIEPVDVVHLNDPDPYYEI